MPKKKYSEQTINAAKLSGRTPAQQQAISQRVSQKRANVKADRLATARRAARPKKKPPVVKPKPKPHWREGIAEKIPWIKALSEALKPKKKKSRRR